MGPISHPDALARPGPTILAHLADADRPGGSDVCVHHLRCLCKRSVCMLERLFAHAGRRSECAACRRGPTERPSLCAHDDFPMQALRLHDPAVVAHAGRHSEHSSQRALATRIHTSLHSYQLHCSRKLRICMMAGLSRMPAVVPTSFPHAHDRRGTTLEVPLAGFGSQGGLWCRLYCVVPPRSTYSARASLSNNRVALMTTARSHDSSPHRPSSRVRIWARPGDTDRLSGADDDVDDPIDSPHQSCSTPRTRTEKTDSPDANTMEAWK